MPKKDRAVVDEPGNALFDVLNFVKYDEVNRVVRDELAHEVGGIRLLECLEVEDEVGVRVAWDCQLAALFDVHVAVGERFADAFRVRSAKSDVCGCLAEWQVARSSISSQ